MDFLANNPDETETMKYIIILKQNAVMMLYMVNDILDLAKFNNKTLKINAFNFNLVHLIEEITQLMAT